ncbi:diacylglycerol/lipid kinase family protein [Bacillus piscicola]|uniref:diacylglycerol/lipid kinase family protein n=1 Tax=Bacillus piscicola TaxID=1632684 RepID=UPI001F09AC9B|nr:diacylglycerol kinase family protein [Bacillus piscicola]
MFNKALLLVNGAGSESFIQKCIELTAGVVASQVGELTIRRTAFKGEAEELCREQGEGYDVLFILGGDGLVHECINGLAPLSSPPVIGILPGGTCNDFSRGLQIPQSLKKAAVSLLEGGIQEIDMGQMNERWFSNFFGIGLIAETSENINEDWKNIIGKMSYFISALQTFQRPEAFHFKIKMDGTLIEGEAVMILVVNGKYIGTNLLPFPEILLDDGLFDVYIVSEGGAALLKEYLNAKNPFNWDPVAQSDIQHYQSKHVYLETAKPKKADTDGEVYVQTPVSLTNIQRKLSFLVPAVFS